MCPVMPYSAILLHYQTPVLLRKNGESWMEFNGLTIDIHWLFLLQKTKNYLFDLVRLLQLQF